jgi:hypothetical protein
MIRSREIGGLGNGRRLKVNSKAAHGFDQDGTDDPRLIARLRNLN